MIIRKRSQFPKCIRHIKEIKGISIGGCVYGKPILGLVEAHAHCIYDNKKYPGWICLSYKYQLEEKLTLLHEAAHLIANTNKFVAAHGNAWRKVVKEIGGTYKSYPNRTSRFEYSDYSPPRKKK